MIRDIKNGNRNGVTLIELIVTLAILGIILTITTLSLGGKRRAGGAAKPVFAQVESLKSAAVTSGVAQTTILHDSGGAVLVTAFPDGRVLGVIHGLNELGGVVKDRGAK